MSVKLRLARYGSKKKAFYRLVVAQDRARRDGSFIEHVGTYDPRQNPEAVRLNTERVRYWLAQGVLPSDTVKNLLDRHLPAPTADTAS